MSKKEEYLKFYIESNGELKKLEEFIKKENITLNEYKEIVNDYLNELKDSKKINKLYLEYNLKFKNKTENKKINKRKEAEILLNIINNYIKEDKHNIKEYIETNNIDYNNFIKFINNTEHYYLSKEQKTTLRKFLKRENTFNKENLDKVKEVVDKISDDLVNDKPFDIYEYYQVLGWDSNLLIYYLKNNNEIFSNFIIDNVNIYLEKYHMYDNKLKLNEFINVIKKNNKEMKKNEIESIINYMNKYKMPYIYYLFEIVKQNLKNSE